jgi:hypothetical protein
LHVVLKNEARLHERIERKKQRADTTSEQAIAATLKLLIDKEDAAAWLYLDKPLQPGARGIMHTFYFDFSEVEAAARHITRVDQLPTTEAIYFALNPLKPGLKSDHNFTNDDVLRRRYFLIDFDPRRSSGKTSATDAEKEAARQSALRVREFLIEQGWPEAAISLHDSGNGWHLLIRIEEKNSKPTTVLLKLCLLALAARFDNAAVKVDPGVFDAKRISKLYGTMTRKGDNTPDRPWRSSALGDIDQTAPIISHEQLSDLASLAPKVQAMPSKKGAKIDIDKWIEKFREKLPDLTGPYPFGEEDLQGHTGRKWTFEGDHCGLDKHTKGHNAAILQNSDGRVGWHCFKGGCNDKTFADLRDLIEGSRLWRMNDQFSLSPTRETKTTSLFETFIDEAKPELMKDAEGYRYITINSRGFQETYDIESPAFQDWLLKFFNTLGYGILLKNDLDQLVWALKAEAGMRPAATANRTWPRVARDADTNTAYIERQRYVGCAEGIARGLGKNRLQ